MNYGYKSIKNCYDEDKCLDVDLVSEEYEGKLSRLYWMKEESKDGSVENSLWQDIGDKSLCIDVLSSENSFDQMTYNGKVLKLGENGKVKAVYIKSPEGSFVPYYKPKAKQNIKIMTAYFAQAPLAR